MLIPCSRAALADRCRARGLPDVFAMGQAEDFSVICRWLLKCMCTVCMPYWLQPCQTNLAGLGGPRQS